MIRSGRSERRGRADPRAPASKRYRSWLLPLVVLTIASGDLAAQDRALVIPPGDTVIYSERSRHRILLSTDGGDALSTLARDATISLTSTEVGRWHGSYLDLDVRSIRPGGFVAPDREFLMGRPFVLDVSPRGNVHLVEGPTIPRAFRDMFDPETQFLDFFVSLPDEDLAPGLTWSDSIASTDSAGPSPLQAVRTMRVVGDTVIEGVDGWVIETSSSVRVESSLRVPGWEGSSSRVLEGSEKGEVVYDAVGSRLLHRRREGVMSGILLHDGQRIPAEVRYDVTISIRP